MKLFLKSFLLCSLMLVVATSCDDESTDPDPSNTDFDRSALLQDMADLIDSSYQEYMAALETMSDDASAFTSAPSPSTLNALRASWSHSLMMWQHVAPYSFGIASEQALEASTNMYPTSVSRIESNIESGEYNLNTAGNLSAIGLQAMDYLLYGVASTDAEIITAYTSAAEAGQRKLYLSEVVSQVLDKTQIVVDSWSNSASYRADFIANDGTDQGSSLGLFLNAFNQSFEKSTRTNKLGIPAGALTFSMTPNPATVEAYYEADQSIAYLSASIDAFERIYLGQDDTSVGLDDYLIALDARHGSTSLDEAIREQISQCRSSIALLQNPLSDFVVSDQQTAMDAFADLQALVVLWKVDMMSSLSILITYQDTDGD